MADETPIRCYWVWNGSRCEKDHGHRGPHHSNNLDWPLDLTPPKVDPVIPPKMILRAAHLAVKDALEGRIKALEQALADAKAKVAPLEAKVADMVETIKRMLAERRPAAPEPSLSDIGKPPENKGEIFDGAMPGLTKALPAVAAVLSSLPAPKDLRAVHGITRDMLPKGTQVVRPRSRAKKG